MTDTGQDIGGEDDPYYAGDTLRIEETITEPDDTAKDLTGATVEWAVARRPGESTALDDSDTGVSVTLTDAANGEVQVDIDPGTTDDLVGEYVHEFQVTDAANDQDTVTRGEFLVDADVVD